jgi:hypothetical protein
MIKNKTTRQSHIRQQHFKVTGNHQEGDPRMRMFYFYIKMLNILTMISHNFDCLNKNKNKTDEAFALTVALLRVTGNHQ